ncbi:MAG TPA: sigma-70 family RNA polymerase sigma factor [Pirellulales bacterium]|nr:sigma-70 family RNA polymerase sigma factor [Pirellulales bacterium]
MDDGRMAQVEAVYRSHAPALLRYLQRNFASCACAEDLLQETFLRWLSRSEAEQTTASPRAFLFGIARHVGLTAARRSRRKTTEAIGEVAARPQTETDADLQRMQTAIATLPQQIRETLELRLRDELSYEEIAAALEIPVGTVRSRLHNALQLLRAAMT